jgi:hypothetical protein
LNSAGVQLQGNDDNGPLCIGLRASISASLGAGTYYVVSEGYGGNTGSITTSIRRTDSCPSNLTLNLHCYLQGYYDLNTGQMQPVLTNQGLSVASNVCDSIQVEIRQGNAPYNLVQSAKTELMQNGTAVCSFQNLIGNHYIVVKHRNALETWSASPVNFTSSTVNYDFADANNKAYGSNQVELNTGVWGFFTGNIFTILDDNIDLLDLSSLEEGIGNFMFGYQASDLNGDGNVDLLDGPVIEANVSNFVFSAHP